MFIINKLRAVFKSANSLCTIIITLFTLAFLFVNALQSAANTKDGSLEQMVNTDCKVSQLLAEQEDHVSALNQSVSDFASGRISQSAALNKAKSLFVLSKNCHDTMKKINTPGMSQYLEASLYAISARNNIVHNAVTLLNSSNVTRDNLIHFQTFSGRSAQKSTEKWLQARKKLCTTIVKRLQSEEKSSGNIVDYRFKKAENKLSENALDYYSWQLKLLPLQVNEVSLSGDLSELLTNKAVNNQNISEKDKKNISALVNKAKSTSKYMSLITVPDSLLASQACYINEISLFVKYAQAVESLITNQDMESAGRVTKVSADLQKSSLRASRANLNALKACRLK